MEETKEIPEVSEKDAAPAEESEPTAGAAAPAKKSGGRLTAFFIKKPVPVVLLVLIILMQLLNIVNVIVNEKKGYHSDEMFSFGMANGFYTPYIDSYGVKAYANKENATENTHEWVSADVLREYITVQPGEQFRYDSVWYNLINDRHPPLYEACLHTISSFFPDTFSPWFGYVINLACFVATQIFLYKLARLMLKSRYLALLVCTIWGFSLGAIGLTIFIRMYCMLAVWTVIFFYLHAKLYQTKEQPLMKQLIPIIIITALGSLTQYIFLFVAFVTALCFCIRYLLTKRFKVFFAYGFSMLGGVLLALAAFPAMISHFLYEMNRGSGYDVPRQFRMAILYFFREVFPLGIPELIFLAIVIPTILLTGVIFSVPVLYLLRDKPKVSAFLSRLKSGAKAFPSRVKNGIRNFSLKRFFAACFRGIKRSNPITFITVLSIVVVSYLTASSESFIGMGYVDRYLFLLYPVFAAVITSLIYFVISWFRYKKVTVAAVLLIALYVGFTLNHSAWLFRFDNTVSNLRELTAGADCIVVSAAKTESWTYNTLCSELYDADQIFLTYYEEVHNDKAAIESLEGGKDVYLLSSVVFGLEDLENADKEEEEYNEFIEGLSVTEKMEYLGTYTIFYRVYKVYHLAD